MKNLIVAFSVLVHLGLLAVCRAGGNPEDALIIPGTSPPAPAREVREEAVLFSGPADWVYQASDWVLNLYIVSGDARTRVSHGILLFEGEEVRGNPGEIRALPMGTIEYHGRARDRKTPVEDSGWQMKDPLVKPRVNTSKGSD